MVSVGQAERGDIPAVAHHTHPLGLSHAVKLGRLLQILLAPFTFSIAKASFGHRIGIAPIRSNLVALECKDPILFNAPSVHVALTELVYAEGELRLSRLSFLSVAPFRIVINGDLEGRAVGRFP